MADALDVARARLGRFTFDCIPGCSDCCGPSPVLDDEAERIAAAHPMLPQPSGGLTPVGPDLTCAYAGNGGCAIYAERPLMCRGFGAVDHPMLACPHGRRPKRLMPEREFCSLIDLLDDGERRHG